jgi:hypothetical protein
MSILRTRHHSGDGQYFCAICNELVKVEIAKTDGDGHAVHDGATSIKSLAKSLRIPRSRLQRRLSTLRNRTSDLLLKYLDSAHRGRKKRSKSASL